MSVLRGVDPHKPVENMTVSVWRQNQAGIKKTQKERSTTKPKSFCFCEKLAFSFWYSYAFSNSSLSMESAM